MFTVFHALLLLLFIIFFSLLCTIFHVLLFIILYASVDISFHQNHLLREIWEKMEQETGFNVIPFIDILSKFLDVAFLNFCVFRLSKHALVKHRLSIFAFFNTCTISKFFRKRNSSNLIFFFYPLSK